jgi:hypothetical protein
MDLEGFFGLFMMLLHWRVTVSLIVGIVLAISLVNTLTWFNGLQGMVVAVLGFLFGALWEDTARGLRATAPTGDHGKKETKPIVQYALALVMSAFWGVFSATSMESFLAGAVVFVLVAWAWYKHAACEQVRGSRDQAVICILLAGLIYPLVAAWASRAVFGS